MAKFPTYEQMAKDVAEKALDEILYDGKSIREWMKIIVEQEPTTDVLDKIRAEIQTTIDEERTGNGNINKGVVIGLQMALDTVNRCKAESEEQE